MKKKNEFNNNKQLKTKLNRNPNSLSNKQSFFFFFKKKEQSKFLNI